MSDELEVLRVVSERLESLGLRYMLTGSFAMAFYTTPRMTRDLDLVVELAQAKVSPLVAAFSPDFYVDEDVARDAVRHARLFNLMHLGTGLKVDLIVRKDLPFRRLEFERRRQVTVGNTSLWVVSREDLILSKLVCRMTDTTPEMAKRVAERHAEMTVEERVRAAASMYETARAIVEASIPAGIQGEARRYQVLKRFYGDEVPEAALRACAAWQIG
ncbi:MAG: hypothetical protein KF790_11290 [Steroidobacteraceae bacterium]|nr:hypothetical protein [Steroidobacteraceae bacterium]